MGMQISYCFYSKVSEENIIWSVASRSWINIQEIGAAQGK